MLLIIGAALVALAAIGLAAIGSARAAPPVCSDPPSPTKSADGTVVFGSACSDTIVVTSPAVEKVYGGEGNDVIYADSTVEEVKGGGGDDVIYGEQPGPDREAGAPDVPAPVYTPESEPGGEATARASAYEEVNCTEKTSKGEPCYGGPGSQKLMGGEGKDTIFGQRGNDALFGEGEADALYGGIGDDKAYGGTNNDLVTGGFGTDVLDGSNGNDLVRGDATGDVLKDQGATGVDTVSYATAGSPGWKGAVGITGYPADANNEERGVSINLNGGTGCPGFEACNNSALFGGGNDEIEAGDFENVIGSAFADLIQGSSAANRIDGGGGTDYIIGNGGNDTLNGGAEGDYIEGGEGTDTGNGEAGTDNCASDVETRPDCQGTASSVTQRDRTKISVGVMVAELPSQISWAEPYMVGSTAHDEVNVEYTSSNRHVVFKTAGSSAAFNLGADVVTKGCAYQSTEVSCTLPAKPDAVLLAAMGADDQISISGFEPTASPVILGGEGNDVLFGSGTTEDVLVDGDGAYHDTTFGFKFDDALVNYLGVDNLQGGLGNDLLISGTVCEGDTLQGAESGKSDEGDRNNASWALLPEASGAVWADLAAGKAGNKSGGACSAGTSSELSNIDDMEGSNQSDHLFGDGNDNSLFARPGVDELFGRGGNDFINTAEDGTHDEIGGGDGNEDECKFDKGVDSHSGCEFEIPIE
jgi:Ca2+-binding RTX toxin-like protein